MSVLSRWIVTEVLRATGVVTAVFIALFLFFDFVDQLDDIGRGAYGLNEAALYVVLRLPSRLYELLPIALLVGALAALAQLARHSELAVLRASGMSVGGLWRILALAALIQGVIIFVVGEWLVPSAEQTARSFRVQAMGGGDFSTDMRSGLWIREGEDFLNVRRLGSDGRLRDLEIYRFGPDRVMTAIDQVKEAEFDPVRGVWRLKEVQRRRLAPERITAELLPELEWSTELTPRVLAVLMVEPYRMSIGALYTFSRHLIRNGQNADRYLQALGRKLVYPLTALVMVTLALPFALGHARGAPIGFKVFLGTLLGVAFHLLNSLSGSLGVLAGWSPWVAAALPGMAFMALALAMMHWVERR